MCIGLFKNNNFEIVNDPAEAEIIIINTCGFIETAKQEAINTIIEMAEYKNIGNCKYLIAMGCLVQRYKKELEKLLPEVDLFLSIDDYDNIWQKINDLLNNDERNNKNKSSKSKIDEKIDKNLITNNSTEKIIQCCNLNYLDRVISTGNTTA